MSKIVLQHYELMYVESKQCLLIAVIHDQKHMVIKLYIQTYFWLNNSILLLFAYS